MSDLAALRRLARLMGVATSYEDGLDREVVVSPDTLMRVCTALGAPIDRIRDAAPVLASVRAERAADVVPPVVVAWDGRLPADVFPAGATVALPPVDDRPRPGEGPIPPGYHRIVVEHDAGSTPSTVISAPRRAWQPDQARPGWGVAAQLAALRSDRSRSVGDLADLRTLAAWVERQRGDVVTMLPLLPTFNDPPIEPSPYSPVSRLFWSELILDLGDEHQPVADVGTLSVEAADAEVRAALAGTSPPDPTAVDAELARYAAFRATQRTLGRDWRRWPDRQRRGRLGPDDGNRAEARFHLAAQTELRHQLADLRRDLEARAVRLGLDLAVGVHPLGYDVWSRPELFAAGIAVGAPPDAGFPSGQSWGFAPVLPERSRAEGHDYLRAGIAHQAALADVLRIDHVMAMHRLYWIPDGMDLAEGTYVRYPTDELFAILCLESHRHRCELIGENLGTVPDEIDRALPRHGIHGTYLAEFEANGGDPIEPPTRAEVAMIGAHDTPTFAGWLDASDVDARVDVGLLEPSEAPRERSARAEATTALARELGGEADDPAELLSLLLAWLGSSPSPLVVVWLEDLWLESRAVNVPGSTSTQRPNWRRPMDRSLDRALADPEVNERVSRLDAARRTG